MDRYVFIDGDGDGFPDGDFMFWIIRTEARFLCGDGWKEGIGLI